MMNNIPIVIPIKGVSIRCSNKNEILLPFTLKYLKYLRAKNVYVISEDEKFSEIVKSFGFYFSKENINSQKDELHSCWNILNKTLYSEIILIPVTSPFRHLDLIQNLINTMSVLEYDVDFITTCNTMPNRKQYLIEKERNIFKFKYQYVNRKGELCEKSNLIIDGSAYLIKREFLQDVVNSTDSNEKFWSGRFSCIMNNVPFIDIDSTEDLEKFLFITKSFLKYV